jgi:hypothetical protein
VGWRHAQCDVSPRSGFAAQRAHPSHWVRIFNFVVFGFVFSPTLKGVFEALASFLQNRQIRRIGFVA